MKREFNTPNHGKVFHVYGLVCLMSTKCLFYRKQSADLMHPIKIMMIFSSVEVNLCLQSNANASDSKKAILISKKQSWTQHIADFKMYYRKVMNKTPCYWHNNRHENYWNKIKPQ